MPTKQELVDEAHAQGISIPAGATKAEVETLLAGSEPPEATAQSGDQDPQPAQMSSMPVARYTTDLTPAERRYKLAHWP